ncbi:GCN5-related N-acetyltransferase [Hyella patelloides LEGE 07179]|uniref:GCN5-related N-acetyltransferase n=1 Tax=Hyella patelloides LEGE 07179 TaxID=945734 RepID=A0A563W0E0_9CYAN|nr:GNAT family N-acetyltransferase [Hyella patelloides]VEP17146.1 GCN5-related N-acetyltransferase [Hyella patelloides LEGE 07179]
MDCSHIQFCLDKSRIDLDKLQELLTLSSFWAKNRRIEDMATAISNSNPVVTVWDNERLIGFARATSDGIYRAAIWDVVIHPDYRGYGLGCKLVETVLTHPIVNKVERVYLTTTNHKSFYQRIGFQPNTTTTMVLHNNQPVDSVSLLEEQVKM